MLIRSVLLAGALLVPHADAAARQVPMVVDVDWLAEHARDANLVLLHVGDRREYDAGHIPGARFIAMSDVSAPHDHDNSAELALELPHPDTLRGRLERLGISDDSRIVVYYGNDWVSPATRVIFALDWIGLGQQTSLLNGGMRAWTRAGHDVTPDAPAVRTGSLTPRTPKSLVVDAAFAQSVPARDGNHLVDGRAAVFYRGIEPTYDKAGHIPGATNIPFTSITDDDLIIDAARLETLFRTAGVRPGDVVVGYCHIGQQATAMLFAARLLGHDVRLYDGSFQDWATRNRGPVER
jgi:thiosulfate/3-mercaptopyruvate sulfurtransferase